MLRQGGRGERRLNHTHGHTYSEHDHVVTHTVHMTTWSHIQCTYTHGHTYRAHNDMGCFCADVANGCQSLQASSMGVTAGIQHGCHCRHPAWVSLQASSMGVTAGNQHGCHCRHPASPPAPTYSGWWTLAWPIHRPVPPLLPLVPRACSHGPLPTTYTQPPLPPPHTPHPSQHTAPAPPSPPF